MGWESIQYIILYMYTNLAPAPLKQCVLWVHIPVG